MPLKIKLLVDLEISGTKIVLEAEYGTENQQGEFDIIAPANLVFFGKTVGANINLGEATNDIFTKFNISFPDQIDPIPSFLQEIDLQDIYVSYFNATKELNLIATFDIEGIKARIVFQRSLDDSEGRFIFALLADITVIDWKNLGGKPDGIAVNDAGFIYASDAGEYSFPRLVTENSETKISTKKVVDLNEGFNYPFKIKIDELVIDTNIADSFIKKIVPVIAIENPSNEDDTDNTSGKLLSISNGLLQIHLNTHWKLGPVDIPALYILLGYKDNKWIIGLAVDVKASLSVFNLFVENFGILANITKNDPYTSLKDFSFDLGFKFPTAIALSINAQKFSGGGYLYIGENRYAGVVHLNFADNINFTAITIINTKLPGGKEGYALLLFVMVDGFAPIQLGMGFTLNGIGGMLALNRTMKLDVLREGVRTGMNERLLFPKDPLENIDFILADLEAAFPIEEKRFVFGPMFILGWGGARALLTVKVGLFIEVPSPIRIAIMGVLDCILPTEGANTEVLVLKVSFTGTFDLEKKFITFDATLAGSRLLNFSLDGDMAFRLKYGENPNFLISMGGFHPAFQPPPLALPPLKRITVGLLDTSDAQVRFETYFAVTSNTVQLGAQVHAVFAAGKYDAVGYLGFDALFQFNPFHFMFDTYLGFSLLKDGKEKASVNVRLHLDGPTPWHVSGTAKAKILGIEFEFDFDRTFGESRLAEGLPNINVLSLLKKELENVENWKAILPSGRTELVQVRVLEPISGLIMNPNGSLTINQRIMPLKTQLDKYGDAGVEGPAWFEIKEISVGGDVQTIVSEEDFFAPAQYKALSETTKVTGPSFSKFESGVRMGSSDAVQTGPFTKREIRYEQILIDGSDSHPIKDKIFYTTHLNALSQNSAVGKSTLAKNNQAKWTVGDRRVDLKEENYQIVRASDLSVYNTGEQPLPHNHAKDILAALFKDHPELEDELILVPA